MTRSRAHREAVAAGDWPPHCDCCDVALCAPSYPGPVIAGHGVGLYCERCWIALDRWHAGWPGPDHGLPQRCPDHLPARRMAAINKRNIEYLERRRGSVPTAVVPNGQADGCVLDGRSGIRMVTRRPG